jgi:predicted PurR-regulated permease PerM
MIIRPFVVAILSAAALAYIFYPFYLAVLDSLPKGPLNKSLASFIICTVIVLLVLVPLAYLTIILLYELRGGYSFMQEYLPQWSRLQLPSYLEHWPQYFPQFKEVVSEITGQIVSILQDVLKQIPNVVLGVFITIFSCYYFLKHGKDIYKFFSELLPLPEGRYKQILARFDDISRGMIMGQIVVGIIQGILAWLGFLVLGVPNPVLWGTLTAIISIIPLLGAVMVWAPIVVYLIVIGMVTGEYWRAVTLFLWGTFVISAIDNILKPKIVGEHARIHPLIILFGILGGIQLFGIPGILIGPLILTIFDVVIEIYKESL